MRKLKNVLKSGGRLAMKVITDHGDTNPLFKIRNHKYKAQNYPCHQSEEYDPV